MHKTIHNTEHTHTHTQIENTYKTRKQKYRGLSTVSRVPVIRK